MSRKAVLILALPVVALSILVTAVACGGHGNGMGGMMGNSGMISGNQPAGSIRVDLVNWEVEPAQSLAKAGSVTFWAFHDMGHQHMSGQGGSTHDLQVMKKNSDGSFEMAGQIQGLTMGQAKELTLSLTPGDYELSCNVVEQVNGKMISHYKQGMHTEFKVTE